MKTVIFDFDGTLTQKNQNIWKLLWESLGYKTDKTSIYSKLYIEHCIKKTITRNQWFNLTCVAFKKKGMTKQTLNDVSSKIKLIDGADELIKNLYNKGFSLHIVSGCLKQSIEYVLGDLKKYFTNIESNEAIFDANDKLVKLKATDFDFKGKADYINNLMKETNSKPSEFIFIGNGDNDEWVYLTGCKTICINPDKTNHTNRQIWNDSFNNVSNIQEIEQVF